MIKSTISSIIAIILLAVLSSFYLQPNDFIGCDKKPGGLPHCNTADAIVAVSGGDTKARALKAIDLYKNGWADKIIFSGAAKDKSGPSNAAAMKAIALEQGVEEGHILLDEFSETTQQNAKNTESIIKKNNIRTVILVTSGYHQRRANLEFSKYNEKVVVFNYPLNKDKDWSSHWWLTPNGWWLTLSELVKIVMFYVSSLWL
ncbi:MAG: YdcF family protein [Candidatus Saccharimonadales bacterium]